jgi:hypothetical protein
MPLSPFHRKLLEEFPYLPPNAIIPLPVAAAVEGCSTKAIRRRYWCYCLRANPGSLAIFAAIRRASSLVSSLAADRRPSSSSK